MAVLVRIKPEYKQDLTESKQNINDFKMGKSKKKREYSSDSDPSSDSEEIEKSRKSRKQSKKSKKSKSKKKKRERSSSSSSSNSEDAWIEKNVDKSPSPEVQKTQREDWMSADNFFLPTFSKEKPQTKSSMEKSNHQVYDPATSSRELNPYFKTGEGGMPSFQKPKDDDDEDYRNTRRVKSSQSASSGGWRKSRQETSERRRERSRSRSNSPIQKERLMLPAKPTQTETDQLKTEGTTASHSDFLTDEQMNEIGAKMIKAELMGNESLANKLKGKLERAKAFKSSGKAPPQSREKDHVVLSITNAAGVTRPATQGEDSKRRPQDKKKNKRVETHQDGERMKYYPDDGKYDIKQMVNTLNNEFNYLINVIYSSLNVRNTWMEKIKTSSLPKPSAKSRIRIRWTWQTFSQTTSEKTSRRKPMSAMTRSGNTREWRRFSTLATSALIRRRWTKTWWFLLARRFTSRFLTTRDWSTTIC